MPPDPEGGAGVGDTELAPMASIPVVATKKSCTPWPATLPGLSLMNVYRKCPLKATWAPLASWVTESFPVVPARLGLVESSGGRNDASPPLTKDLVAVSGL